MEIHVDLLNAETNEWIAGDAVKVRLVLLSWASQSPLSIDRSTN
jgi:hypothetical protein